ncbi:MAG: hypothetical protein D6718_06790 [Acidobacteria bacterium]|nr:MAG: hypothetical protein D6718_06790 [Acidobacteriota bacterium]
MPVLRCRCPRHRGMPARSVNWLQGGSGRTGCAPPGIRDHRAAVRRRVPAGVSASPTAPRTERRPAGGAAEGVDARTGRRRRMGAGGDRLHPRGGRADRGAPARRGARGDRRGPRCGRTLPEPGRRSRVPDLRLAHAARTAAAPARSRAAPPPPREGERRRGQIPTRAVTGNLLSPGVATAIMGGPSRYRRPGVLRRIPPAVLAMLSGLAWAAGASLSAGYHDTAEVERQLAAWAAAHPGIAEVSAIGASAAGSPLLVIRIAGPGEIPPEERPALFVGANVDGRHNAGTEAALALVRKLLDGSDRSRDAIARTTFFVAPVLNPDAHDAFFGTPRAPRTANGGEVDRDRDGFAGEDGPDDLDGDGVIRMLRIPDPAGEWLPDPIDPRLMVRRDPRRRRAGAFRLVVEGEDDDGDGRFNEDGPGGIDPDRNFPHAFPFPDPAAGPWPSAAPETRAILDFLLAHRRIAAAVIFGPANDLLALPPERGRGASGGTPVEIPGRFARRFGLEPGARMTLDELWDRVKDLPFVRSGGLDKDRLAAMLAPGPAKEWDAEDRADLARLAEAYRERLRAAGLDPERRADRSGPGGLAAWLYFQYGAFAFSLDVWGPPRPRAPEPKEGDTELTAASLSKMTREEFAEIPPDRLERFLRAHGVAPDVGAASVIDRVRAGEISPEDVAALAAAREDERARGEARRRALFAWAVERVPGAYRPWTAVRLKDGRAAETGGLDPFLALNPPREILDPALDVHVETVLDLADKLPRLEIASLEVRPAGRAVFTVRAVAANSGFLATHTRQAARARVHLPVRLSIRLPEGAALLAGRPWVAAERLAGVTGRLEAEWLVHAPEGGAVEVEAVSDQAGRASAVAELRGTAR